jgi:G3E family GTPase
MAAQVNEWLKTLVLLAGIIFAGGGYAMKVSGHDREIESLEDADTIIIAKVDAVKDDVHRIELDAKDIKSLASDAAQSHTESKAMFEKIMNRMDTQSTAITELKVQYKTLTKDD